MKINIGVKENKRLKIVKGLNRLLADSYLLYLKTHNFHWNVEGPMFNTLHQMFMDQYTELWNSLDLIAERIRALGAYAPGSYQKYMKLASIKEATGEEDATEMIKQLLAGHQAVAKTARALISVSEKGEDEVTLDLVAQRLLVHEKTAWMLRSLLQKD